MTAKDRYEAKDHLQKRIALYQEGRGKRDIAEGRTFNNSFTGPYPDAEETDHLHIDKGPNPQFAPVRIYEISQGMIDMMLLRFYRQLSF